MKICQECGHENPNDVDFCQECGRNFKANIVKANNSPAIINSALYKVDKKTGDLRLSKTKAISLSSFTVIVLFFILMGQLFPASAMWIPILAGLMVAVPVAIVLYLLGYLIAGILEKFNI